MGIDAHRLKRALVKFRLWTHFSDGWRDMTDFPLMWWLNKRAGYKSARVYRSSF